MIIKKISASAFTRPNDTTAYASGDLVANSTTAGSVAAMTFPVGTGAAVKIVKVELLRSNTSVTNASFRLHLYSDTPTVSNGDNGAIASTRSAYQGFIDIVGTAPAFSDAAAAHGVYVNNSVASDLYIPLDKDGKLYGLLEARGAYTPAAQETFTVSLIGEVYT